MFLRAIQAVDRYRDPSVPYRAYLLRVARNLTIDHWRRSGAGRYRHLTDRELPDQPDPGPGPEAAVVARDEHSRLMAALDRLPDNYSDVLRLRILHGLTAAEVGDLRGQTPNAIRQLQYRALAALRRELVIEIGAER